MARQSGSRDDGPHRLHLWQIQAVRDLLLAGVLALVVWLGYAMRAVTVPLLVALLLAYLFEPLVARLTARRAGTRPLVVGGVLATVGVLVVGSLALLIPAAAGQTADLVREYQQGAVRRTATRLAERLPEGFREQVASLIAHLPADPREPAAEPAVPPTPAEAAANDEARLRAIVREEVARAAARTQEPPRWLGVAKGGVRAVGALLGGIIQLGFLAFLIPFYFFFFSVSFPAVVRFGRSLIPGRNRKRVLELVGKMDAVVAGFVRGRIVISVLMGAMLAIGWRIVGVPYSIVLGFVVGIFCAVPYLGAVGVPVAVLLLAFREFGGVDGHAMSWWGIILWPSLVFCVVQVIEGYGLVPLIAGKATNLDPVTIVVAVLAGGSIMGIYGMLLGIPVAACLKVIVTDVLLPKVRAWASGESPDPLP